MANLPLAFSELLAGGIFLAAATTNGSIPDVVKGVASSKPLPGAGGSSSSGDGGPGPAGGPAGVSGYVNPFPGATASRVDMGVDYTGSKFLAPGKSRIVVVEPHSSGWAGGGYIAGELLDGPYKGKVWYMAEGLAPIVRAGDLVSAGQSVAHAIANPYNNIVGNIEAGWANPQNPRDPLAHATGGYHEGQSTAAGASFNRFVQALGGPLGRLVTAIVGDVKGLALP